MSCTAQTKWKVFQCGLQLAASESNATFHHARSFGPARWRKLLSTNPPKKRLPAQKVPWRNSPNYLILLAF
jgi:hypothetical protein